MNLCLLKPLAFALCSLGLTSVFGSQRAFADTLPAATSQVDILCGTTTLKLDKKLVKKLQVAKAKVAYTTSRVPSNMQSTCSVENAAKGSFKFPILLGKANPTLQNSSLQHSGGLRFKYKKRSVRFTNLTLDTKTSSVSTVVGKKRLLLFSLKLKKVKPVRTGADISYTGVKASLKPAAARYLRKKLGTRIFKKGSPFGQIDISLAFKQMRIKSGTTTAIFDPALNATLQSQNMSATALAPASSVNGGLALPMSGGLVDPKLAPGVVTHTGGIAFTRGDQQVQFTDLELRFEADKALISAFNGVERQDILGLIFQDQLPSLEDMIPGTSPVTFGDIGLKLTPQIAATLNQAFLTTAFSANAAFGIASIKLDVQ